MAIDENRRTAFGALAELYDEVRPRYSREVIETTAKYAGVSESSRVLEIGAGTGIATLPFAERGCVIDAVEPSVEMAAVARRNLAHFPNVTIHDATLEEADLDTGQFDLVFAAQAWHWVDHDRRCDLVVNALRPGGAIAIFGNAVTTNFEEGQAAYREHVPEWFVDYKPLPPMEERIEEFGRPIASDPRFVDLEVHRFGWVGTYTADEYVRMMSTASDHAIVPEPRRTQMFDALAQVIEDLGGRIERAYETLIVQARVAPTG